jgi:hypothetical protein
VVPRVEREEFINVGVILYSREQQFLEVLFHLDENKCRALSADIDIQELKSHLRSIERICKGDPESGPIGKMDIATRFRWLTATRSTVVQASKVHPGMCNDPILALQKLFTELVL